MKKLIAFLFLVGFVLSSYGQTTYYTCGIPRGGISTSQNRICDGNMTISGDFGITNNANVKLIRVYTVTGQSFNSFESHTDIYSIGLVQGIYIILKEYDNGETEHEKIIIK